VTIDPAETAERQRQIEQTARRRREEDTARRDTAAQQAQALWSGASREINGHPYLAAKRIKAHGIRRSGDRLLIPVADATGALHGIQAIGPDGAKRFNTGATVGGHFHLIGTPAGWLYLREGYATGATVHEATGAAARLAGIPRTLFLSKLADYGVDTFRLTEDGLERQTSLA